MTAAPDLSADFAAMTDPAPPEAVPVPPPADPWLARRRFGFGASEIALVLVALGWRSEDILASHQKKKNTRPRRKGIPRVHRVFLEKAGLVAPLKMNREPNSPPEVGKRREPELVRRWLDKVKRGTAGPDCLHLQPSTAHYVERRWPRQMLPIVDPQCFRLRVSPDVLISDCFGALECWDAKCSLKPYAELTDEQRAAGVTPLREHHRIQVNAQIAACNAGAGGVLEGEGWSATYRDHAGEAIGPIVSRAVERDDELIRELRAAATEGWARVEEARSAWEATQ